MERAVGLGPITAICIYRRDRIDQGALQQHAPVHTNVIANDFVYLSLSAYFQNLPKNEVRELVRSSRERTVAKGEFFFHQEEPATVDRRLARLLLRLAQSIGRNAGRGLTLDVSLSRQDLAELVISTPYTVSRILADWRRLDIVDA